MLCVPHATKTDNDVREVSHKHSYVIATARDYEGFSVLSVYKSIRCRDTQSWMRPVLDETDGRCVQWMSSERLSDDSMVGAEAWFHEYIVFHACPGKGERHECIRKEGSDGAPIGESTEGVPAMRVPVLP